MTKPLQVAWFTLEGKLQIIDSLWGIVAEVVQATAADLTTGRAQWQPVANQLGRLFSFWVNESGCRKPTSLAKEICQDLLDTPVFEGGRASVSDLRSFSLAGPGALKGLCFLYDWHRARKTTQAEAMGMMLALLQHIDAEGGWEHRESADLELHDIQLMLCELNKFVAEASKLRN